MSLAGRRFHLVGAGGAGMSGYALVLRELGAAVSGSDRVDGPVLGRLREAGVDVHVGHDAGHVPAGDDVEVVLSTAVPADNPERLEAERRGLRCVGREELLAELSALRRTVAVAGTHGKTTTSSMVAHVLLRLGLDPGYLIGGDLTTTGRNAAWGTGEVLVVEADESDGSFLRLAREVAVVTNVELDHLDRYASLAPLREAFRAFVEGAARAAVVWDRPEVVALTAGASAEVVAFDVAGADLELRPGGSRVRWRGHAVELGVPGEHNARNAVAALEACRAIGADPAAAAAALADFAGAGRRFQRVGEAAAGALVVDDYAHHPTEVAATIAAARTLADDRDGRVVAVFQPHLFSRTRALAAGFGAALAAADLVCLVDVYPARERAGDFPGVTGRLLAQATVDAAPGKPVLWLPRFEDVERVLPARLRAADVVLCLGAGDVDRLARALVA